MSLELRQHSPRNFDADAKREMTLALKSNRYLLLNAVTIAAALASAQAVASSRFDIHTDGSKASYDVYTEGSKNGELETYSEGATVDRLITYIDIAKYDVTSDRTPL